MKETNNVEQRPSTSLSKGARRNQILRRITVVGVIAAVITAAFAGYCLHRERVEEKQKAEELRKEKQDKKEAEKVKSKPETAEQKLERVRKQATEHGYPKNVIELSDKNVETVDFVADYEKKKDSTSDGRSSGCSNAQHLRLIRIFCGFPGTVRKSRKNRQAVEFYLALLLHRSYWNCGKWLWCGQRRIPMFRSLCWLIQFRDGADLLGNLMYAGRIRQPG